MCRLRQSTRAVSWWRPTSVEFSTDWICSRLPCTQEAKFIHACSNIEIHLHIHIHTHTHIHTQYTKWKYNCYFHHAPTNANPLIRENIDLQITAAHKPWCWHNHVLLISVALPHHPASPPMLCDSLTASTKHTERHKRRKQRTETHTQIHILFI